MISADRAAQLARLGYAPLWMETGILSPELFAQQCAEFDTPGADQCTEHYRAVALQAFLATRTSLTDREIDALLKLGCIDPLESFRANFSHSLIRFRGLTEDQFERVAASCDDDGFRRIVSRYRWLRALDSEQVSERRLEDAITDGDGEVHGAVLGRADLTRHIVELLSHKGANRAVRNQAAQMLRSRRFRSR